MESRRLRARPRCRAVACFALISVVVAATASAQQTAPAESKFRSPDDGWIDISRFLGTKGGFLPVAAPITEPAVGYGAAAGLAFLSGPLGAERPNITAIGALGTENGTKGALVGDLHYWFGRRLQTLTGLVYATINLDFYGIGSDPALARDPLRYNLEPTGGVFEAKWQPGRWPVWIGAAYAYAKTGVRFDAPEGTPGRPDEPRWSTVATITPSVTVDTRDNLFTPTRGTYVEGRAAFFSRALGGDDEFQRAGVVAMQFVKLPARVFLGVRGEVTGSSGDVPFYLRPFVYQRGVPAMRYQGNTMAQLEAEVRWQFWKRISAVAFGGGGETWTAIAGGNRSKQVAAGGLGFRYEIARAYGIHAGADFAYGPDGFAFYIQIGSAWARP